MDELATSVNDLAKACAHSADAAEWQEFLRRCLPLASLAVARVARMWLGTSSPAVVDDIVQEVFLKLCEHERRILREFEPRGEDSFFGLLRIVAASVANDHFRRLYSAKRGKNATAVPLIEEVTNLPALSNKGFAEMHRSVLLDELDRKLRSAPEVIADRDRALFWLYYLQGLTAEEIAAFQPFGLTAKGVESALRRVTIWLRGEIERQKPAGSAEVC